MDNGRELLASHRVTPEIMPVCLMPHSGSAWRPGSVLRPRRGRLSPSRSGLPAVIASVAGGQDVRIPRRAVTAAISSVIALVIFAGGSSLLSGCAGKGQHERQAGRSHLVLTSPFTGEPVSSLRTELIFKIDNIAQARPPTGLPKADIVYLVPVEGGLSRIFAVFSSHIPPVVGPVRSAREEDIKLLRQFGKPAFAFSGAQHRLLPVVEHARIVSLYAGTVGGYFRSSNPIAPHNLYSRTRTLLAEAKGASKARDIGFRFGAAPAGGKPASFYHVAYPAAAFGFRWSAAQHRWLSWMDGRRANAPDGKH